MRRKKTAGVSEPAETDTSLIEAQKRLSMRMMREHDALPRDRRIAATIVGVDVGRDGWARAAQRIDDQRYLLGGYELQRRLGIG
ncbi:hypothetical protein [Falsiroseomonas sp. CW058]|uniref:hypothetical protein n=1 Tax=Falsiroseomonas sp. CW058 TaxID=3388664 RepID=UPI003D31BD7D